ncbi:MAG: LCP family protein [Lachnospiraceae bacterium]|nr:LCP family protein [Lachnospiraceae bacterium]
MDKKTFITILVVLVFFGAVGGYLAYDYYQQNNYDVESFGLGVEHTEYKVVEEGGVKYNFNPRIDTLLYIGVDESGEIDAGKNKGRADAVVLFVLDKDTKKITAISFSRDTMCDVRSFDSQGSLMGTVNQHLAYAYQFAGGGKAGCQNVCWSVSNLMGGIPIEEYIAADISSITRANDLVGSVTVTVPNDDLAQIYPEMVTGARVQLTSDNVEKFVRYRDRETSFSNNSRRERQQAYLNAYLPKFAQCLKNDTAGMWDKLMTLESYTVTSVTRNEYLDMANVFSGMDYNNVEFYSPEGSDREGELHDEFYLDSAAFKKKILDIFYVTH